MTKDVLTFKDGQGHSFETVRAFVWPHIKWAVTSRDKEICQDCGTERSYFEVHHIIPRGLGGSDHPQNLKLVCDECHAKYNEEFNGRIISQKARLRKVKSLGVEPLTSFTESGIQVGDS